MRSGLLCSALALAWCSQAFGQAFCALRDPVRHIRELHEHPVQARSMVATVDGAIHRSLAAHLPFQLHAREFGRHTLYLISHGVVPAGYVHVRSEASPWGMVEVVWSLDEELRVRGFRFQRCRSPQRQSFESDAFCHWISGKGFAELVDVLDEGATGISSDYAELFRGREELAVTVLRSALKAILVTELAWGEAIADRRLQAILVKAAGAEEFELGREDGGMRIIVGRDREGREVGRAARLLEAGPGRGAGVFFAFSPDGQLLEKWSLPSLPSSRGASSSQSERQQSGRDENQIKRVRTAAFMPK